VGTAQVERRRRDRCPGPRALIDDGVVPAGLLPREGLSVTREDGVPRATAEFDAGADLTESLNAGLAVAAQPGGA